MRDTSRTQRGPRRINRRKTKNQDGNAAGQYVSDAWSLAKRTALGLNEIRKLINVEQKYFDRSGNGAPTQAGLVTYLCNMAQGDDITLRDGDSIKLQRFFYDCHITRNVASTANELVRVLIVRDLQNPGATITGADVVAQASTVFAPICQVNVLNGPAYNKRFSVLMDEVVELQANDTNKCIRFKSTHDCHIYYRGNSTAVTDAGNGSIFALWFTDATSNFPNVDFISRMEFTDN